MGGMSKADGRRHSRHAAKYTRQATRVLKHKERNVIRSSHGKFTCDSLMDHQRKIEAGYKSRTVAKVRPHEAKAEDWLKVVPLVGNQREHRRDVW